MTYSNNARWLTAQLRQRAQLNIARLEREGNTVRARKRQDIFAKELIAQRDYAQGRIDNGDLDFDNWVFPLRDAASALIRILMINEEDYK